MSNLLKTSQLWGDGENLPLHAGDPTVKLARTCKMLGSRPDWGAGGDSRTGRTRRREEGCRGTRLSGELASPAIYQEDRARRLLR